MDPFSIWPDRRESIFIMVEVIPSEGKWEEIRSFPSLLEDEIPSNDETENERFLLFITASSQHFELIK